jgi:hypothetical protein
MDGVKCKRRPPLELRREFVGFRLEKQVLVRVYELVVPLLLRCDAEADDSSSLAEACAAERKSVLLPLAKGA